MTDLTEDMSPEEAQMLAQALQMFNEQLRKMMEKLLRGEQLTPRGTPASRPDGRAQPHGRYALPRLDGAAHA